MGTTSPPSVRPSLGSRYWERRLARWKPPPDGVSEGYSLLLPVPGDLPHLLDLALSACAAQDSAHRVETVVIPDTPTAEVAELVDGRRGSWDGPLRLQLLPQPERTFLPRLRSGSRNHGMQLVAGVTSARATHIVLHDADLFPRRHDLHEVAYERCAGGDLACVGVSPVWDPWYAERGLHLAATWEMCASVGWLRTYPPARHIGHDGELHGEAHTFDTTLYAQALSPPESVVVLPGGDDDIVHFNYVITTYRDFQRAGPGFVDHRFRLLCIAVLQLLLGAAGPSDVPPVAGLAAGLGSPSAEVGFPPPDRPGVEAWGEFRSKVGRLLEAPWLDPRRSSLAAGALEPFDRYYGRAGG